MVPGDEGTENWQATMPDGSERTFHADRVLIEVDGSEDSALIFVRLENQTIALLPFGSVASRIPVVPVP